MVMIRHENEQNKRAKAQKTRTPPKPEGETRPSFQPVLRWTIVSQTIAICALRQVILRKSRLDVNSR